MSHFSILVIGPENENEIEKVLMPFSENTNKLPRELLKFENHEIKGKKVWDKNKKEISEWYTNKSLQVENDKFNEIKDKKKFTLTKSDLINLDAFGDDNGKCDVYTHIKIGNKFKVKKIYCEYLYSRNAYNKNEYAISLVRIKAPQKLSPQEKYSSFEEYMEEYCGFSKRDEDTGKYGYWVNKKAKWDWYVVGGRWDGWLLLRDGSLSNQAKKSEIDFEAMKAKSIVNAKNNWEEAMKENTPAKNFIYCIKEDDTQESYIKRFADVATFAVVKNGKWYEKGEMGWWAMVKNEKEHDDWFSKFTELINKTKDNEIITVVDCHT